ncbi:MAG: hypothetical protein Crog4KO_07300 [Crocinitomicaceae bacterium]
MNKLTIGSILILALFAISCSSNEAAEDQNGEKLTEETSGKVNIPNSPCDWIDKVDIRTLIGVDAQYEISMEAKDYTFPACSFRWEDGKVVKNMEVAGRKMTVDSPSEVMVVFASDINAEKFERSVQVYKDGENVEGVGEEAMWGAEMSQLSFRKGTVMMHVHVKVDNDGAVNKKHALKIAEFLIAKM